MTLIVARKLNGKVFLITDSLMTDPKKVIQEWHLITPKVLIFDDIAIAFSGVIEPVLQEWAKLPSDLTLEEAASECLAMIKRYPGQIDFCVVRFSDVVLLHIDESACRSVDHAWLGSREAFARFRSHMAAEPNENLFSVSDVKLSIVWEPSNDEQFNSIYTASLYAFQKLLSSTEHHVGGYAIPFLITPDVARYGSYAWITSATGITDMLLKGPADAWNTVNFQLFSADSGSFSYDFVGTKSGFRIVIPQILKSISWHSPFVEIVEPGDSFFQPPK